MRAIIAVALVLLMFSFAFAQEKEVWKYAVRQVINENTVVVAVYFPDTKTEVNRQISIEGNFATMNATQIADILGESVKYLKDNELQKDYDLQKKFDTLMNVEVEVK